MNLMERRPGTMRPISITAKRANASHHACVQDVAFLQAEAKLRALMKALDRAAERHNDVGTGARLIDDACATYHWIRKTAPESLVGAAVKLRTLLHPELGMEFTFHPDDDPNALLQVLAIVERELGH
jgi:hypothetical protein